jgi:hypothetical protein
MPTTVRRVDVAEAYEAGVIRTAATGGPAGSIDVIRSGWNRAGSRFYPSDVVVRDVPQVYRKGTKMFIGQNPTGSTRTWPATDIRRQNH